ADNHSLVGESISVWTFERGNERLHINRDEDEAGPRLTVTQDGIPRSYQFSSTEGLVRFQSDMEAMLVQTGWSFVEFAPDRRRGRDRRGWPRILTDRRRWWTDGLRL